ncbi:MAG: PfkB family carbohydrate kinase [Anaerolineae bacterium]
MLYGINDPRALIDAMLNDGATIVSGGDKGSLVASRQVRYHIPAVPVPQIVDQTGAGNTYSGGFLVGWALMRSQGGGLLWLISASFALEHIGVLQGYDAAEQDPAVGVDARSGAGSCKHVTNQNQMLLIRVIDANIEQH